MPPFVPKRKSAGQPTSANLRTKRIRVDANESKAPKSQKLRENQAFLEGLQASSEGSELSSAEDSEFEDALPQTTSPQQTTEQAADEFDWEDAIGHEGADGSVEGEPREIPSDLEITLDKTAHSRTLQRPEGKPKGPSKIERQIRLATHRMHVQYLLFHNLVRNGWTCDRELQSILVKQLPKNVQKEVQIFRRASKHGMCERAKESVPAPEAKIGSNVRNQRDWGTPAARQETDTPDLSRGDPILRLLRYLALYWKRRFKVTKPALRKQGYKPLVELEQEIGAFKMEQDSSSILYGEIVAGIEDMRRLAMVHEGSLDLGVQLFTALLRGLGLEARLVASLQPAGFSWTKYEEAAIPRTLLNNTSPKDADTNRPSRAGGTSDNDVGPLEVLSDDESESPGRRRKGRKALTKLVNGDEDGGSEVASEYRGRTYDLDLVAPTYWTEVISPNTNMVYPVDCFILQPTVATRPEHLQQFEPKGRKADEARQVFAYAIAYSADGTAKDVTVRYLKGHRWPGRMKNMRMQAEKVAVLDRNQRVKGHRKYDWFKHVMNAYRRPSTRMTTADELEDREALKVVANETKIRPTKADSLQGLKSSAEFILERHLRREEALKPSAEAVRHFSVGKGDKITSEPVFLRSDVEICRTAESWHKEGRAVISGETPLKNVPVRAVTMNRKREVEEAQREGGKLMQGMYARRQTEWIRPPPIEGGRIPKNAYGNIDCFVPSMVPEGAVHLPLRSTARVCKRLDVDFAEAVTGFEFGKRMAIPVISGVVIAAENEDLVRREWQRDEEERRIREEGKREKAALASWRKWLAGLRIIARMREDHGLTVMAHEKEDINPFTNKKMTAKVEQSNPKREQDQFPMQVDKDQESLKSEEESFASPYFAGTGQHNSRIHQSSVKSESGHSQTDTPSHSPKSNADRSKAKMIEPRSPEIQQNDQTIVEISKPRKHVRRNSQKARRDLETKSISRRKTRSSAL